MHFPAWAACSGDAKQLALVERTAVAVAMGDTLGEAAADILVRILGEEEEEEDARR